MIVDCLASNYTGSTSNNNNNNNCTSIFQVPTAGVVLRDRQGPYPSLRADAGRTGPVDELPVQRLSAVTFADKRGYVGTLVSLGLTVPASLAQPSSSLGASVSVVLTGFAQLRQRLLVGFADRTRFRDALGEISAFDSSGELSRVTYGRA